MFGAVNKRQIEEDMAEWLAHPMEFGVRPEMVRYKRTYNATLITYGDVQIHLVDYKMPDGIVGRGFVNDNLTWSFFGEQVNSIKDEDLFVAYCGWAWLFPALQAGTVQTTFVSSGEESKFLAGKQKEGLTDIDVTARYKIGTNELIEFVARRNGVAVKGAGDSTTGVLFTSSDSKFNLPSIYFLLGEQVIESVS